MASWHLSAGFLSLGLCSASAFAQMPPLDTLRGPLNMPSGKSAVENYDNGDPATVIYLKGLTDGLLIAHQAGSEQKFCLPDPAPSVDKTILVLKKKFLQSGALDTLPEGVGIIFALHAEFPCPN
jgi:hypothetical protein